MEYRISYKLVQVVTEELGALVATMAIIDAKEGALRPVVNLALLALGLHNVQNDCHAVLIVVPIKIIMRMESYLTMPWLVFAP
jgi:hypothetical protein